MCEACIERTVAELAAEEERKAARWRPRPCQAPGCANTFRPYHVSQLFCSTACRVRSHRARQHVAA